MIKQKIAKLKFLKKPLIVFGISVIFIRILGITPFPDTIFPSLNQFFSQLLYRLSASFSFSIGDVFYSILILLALMFLTCLILWIVQKKYAFVKKGIKGLIYFLTGFYIVFHLVWGFNYYKIPLKENYNVEVDSLDELKAMAHVHYLKSIQYRELVKEDEKGVFKMSLTDEELKKEIKNAGEVIRTKYPELKMTAKQSPNLKPSLFSEGFSYLGVLGYYNPFTTEAQYNQKMPDSKLVFTKFHETAHQWGYASESEANFVGYVIGLEAQHADLLYASNFKAMRSLLNRILWLEPAYVKNYVDNLYSEGMKRDRQYELDVNAQYGGSAEDAFSLMNEAFLRLNNQEGLESYGQFVELLVGFNRKYGTN